MTSLSWNMRTLFPPSTQSGFGSASWAIVFYSGRLGDVQGYVWLDYFSIPQCVGKDENCPVTRQQQIDAIVSIPAYVEQCQAFLVLCTCPGARRPVREFVRCQLAYFPRLCGIRPAGRSNQSTVLSHCLPLWSALEASVEAFMLHHIL